MKSAGSSAKLFSNPVTSPDAWYQTKGPGCSPSTPEPLGCTNCQRARPSHSDAVQSVSGLACGPATQLSPSMTITSQRFNTNSLSSLPVQAFKLSTMLPSPQARYRVLNSCSREGATSHAPPLNSRTPPQDTGDLEERLRWAPSVHLERPSTRLLHQPSLHTPQEASSEE